MAIERDRAAPAAGLAAHRAAARHHRHRAGARSGGAAVCSRPTRAACRCKLPDWRIQIGGGTIGALDLLIAGIGLSARALLYRLPALHQARLGRARDRAGSRRRAAMRRRRQPREQAVFAIASALGGVSRLARRHVLQLDRSQHGLPGRPQGHRRDDDRRHGQRAGRDRRQPAAGPDRELRHRGVRHAATATCSPSW